MWSLFDSGTEKKPHLLIPQGVKVQQAEITPDAIDALFSNLRLNMTPPKEALKKEQIKTVDLSQYVIKNKRPMNDNSLF